MKEHVSLLGRWLHCHHWQEREYWIVELDYSPVTIALQ
jgi:hypothetical protein